MAVSWYSSHCCDRLCISDFVDDIMFFFNGTYTGMNFAKKDQFCLNLLIYHTVRRTLISDY